MSIPKAPGAVPLALSDGDEKANERASGENHDVAALEAVRNGENEAFAEVVRRYQGRLYNYLYRFAHNKEDSEDLVSDTFVQAFSQLKSCRDLGKFRAWIFRIAHNIGVNFWRKKNRERTWATRLEGLAYEVASWAMSHEEAAMEKEDGRVVDQALRELPEYYRAALLLYYYEDFSYQEMTEILGLPLSSVKTHLFRGRKLLEAKLRTHFSQSPRNADYAYPFAKAAPVRTGT